MRYRKKKCENQSETFHISSITSTNKYNDFRRIFDIFAALKIEIMLLSIVLLIVGLALILFGANYLVDVATLMFSIVNVPVFLIASCVTLNTALFIVIVPVFSIT